MSELLFEIGVEDLPAAYVEMGRTFLQQGVSEALDTLRLPHGEVQAFGTPRRLVVLVRDVVGTQQDWQEDLQGPRVETAWEAPGRLSCAGQGFLRSTGLQEQDLFTKQTPKGEVVAVRKTHKGKPAQELLPKALGTLMGRIPFAKTMQWDDSGARFARPVRWLLCLLHGQVLPMTFGHVQSGSSTRGQRFPLRELAATESDKSNCSEKMQWPNQQISVVGIDHYERVLRENSVMLNGNERCRVIATELERLAQEVGGQLLRDDELLNLVANIVEWPWPIRGEFNKRFLEIPRDILLCEMRTHQKCFAIVDNQGTLLPFFIAVCGTKPQNNHEAAAGNRRVLTARFEDGAFYFAQDCRKSLHQHAQALTGMGFAKGLGSMADKAARIQQLADILTQTLGLPEALRQSVHRAARLCKADLATGVVGEFPQLQGVMGGIYAQRDGEKEEVAQGIAQYYHPRFATDTLPESEVGAIVGLADRLDTLVGVLATLKPPAGNRDPFALRRAAVAVCRLMVHRGYRLSLRTLLPQAAQLYAEQIKDTPEQVATKVIQFLRGRLGGCAHCLDLLSAVSVNSKHSERTQDVTSKLPQGALIEAVAQAGCDDLLDVWVRVSVINRWREQDIKGFDAVTAAFKRVANLLSKILTQEISALSNKSIDFTKHLTHAAEQNLLTDVQQLHTWLQQQDAARLPQEQLVQHYEQLLAQVVAVKPKLDALFDAVMVMDPNPELRQARLWLLGRLQQSLAGIADFKRLAGVRES